MGIAEKVQDLRKSQHIEFSAISGYNYYYLPEGPLEEGNIVALHAQSENVVTLVPVNSREMSFEGNEIEWYDDFFLQPMPTKYFEWPVDLLQCQKSNGKYILYYVFSQRAYNDYVPIRKLLYQKKDSAALDWRNDKICTICRTFLEAMKLLDTSGYAYHDFDIERILYREKTGQVILRHTMHARKKQGKKKLDAVSAEQIAPEFAPPYLFAESFDGYLNAEADYYSIAAILFRLMIGRLPYEGRGLSNYGDVFDPVRDTDEHNHRNYFQHYHKYPHFIFDPTDESNRLAPMQENDLPRERWEKLPEEIKEMFRASLCQAVAEGRTKKGLYTPAQWLNACNRYCWKGKKSGGEENE